MLPHNVGGNSCFRLAVSDSEASWIGSLMPLAALVGGLAGGLSLHRLGRKVINPPTFGSSPGHHHLDGLAFLPGGPAGLSGHQRAHHLPRQSPGRPLHRRHVPLIASLSCRMPSTRGSGQAWPSTHHSWKSWRSHLFHLRSLARLVPGDPPDYPPINPR